MSDPAAPEGHWTMTQGARRAVLMLFAAMVVLGGGSVGLGARTADHLQATQAAQARIVRAQARTVRELDATVRRLGREVRSQCRFDADLAPVPVAVNPATRKASELGVKIVSDSRVAWHQAGCPGRLPPPSPSFARWARYYHLPAS